VIGLIVCVIVGLFIGWLSAAIDDIDEGIFARMGVGALGAILGLALVTMFFDGEAASHLTALDVLASLLATITMITLVKRPRDAESRDRELVS